MGRAKRAVSQVDGSTTGVSDLPAKQGRKATDATASSSQPKAAPVEEAVPTITKKNAKNIPATAAASRSKRVSETNTDVAVVAQSAEKTSKAAKTSHEPRASKAAKASKGSKAPKTASAKAAADSRRGSNFSDEVPATEQKKTKDGGEDDDSKGAKEEEEDDLAGISYWLMKAEPESRIEKGKDVKFSIDDLAACKEPEKWDGVRNLAARNNIRAMMKGDLAFFYHSNCKTPGIAGIMEIVQEHSVDESAFDEDHPYYDEKSVRDKPKWFVVHVEFRQKFPKLVKLKELQQFSKPGGVLENMQMLRQSRLSVSKVTKKEWEFILNLAEDEQSEAKTAEPIDS